MEFMCQMAELVGGYILWQRVQYRQSLLGIIFHHGFACLTHTQLLKDSLDSSNLFGIVLQDLAVPLLYVLRLIT